MVYFFTRFTRLKTHCLPSMYINTYQFAQVASSLLRSTRHRRRSRRLVFFVSNGGLFSPTTAPALALSSFSHGVSAATPAPQVVCRDGTGPRKSWRGVLCREPTPERPFDHGKQTDSTRIGEGALGSSPLDPSRLSAL